MADYNEVISALPYFGNIQFFAHLVQQDILIDTHEHFVKQSLRNRCELCDSQGTFILTVPVHRPTGLKIPTKEVSISYREDWRHTHREAVRSAYGSSPFFIHYWEKIEALWNLEYEKLDELNRNILSTIMEILGTSDQIRFGDRYIASTPGKDLRPYFKKSDFQNEHYIQVFSDRYPFYSNRSILDLLFCVGPQSLDYLSRQELR